jgi:hypothetical protein
MPEIVIPSPARDLLLNLRSDSRFLAKFIPERGFETTHILELAPKWNLDVDADSTL